MRRRWRRTGGSRPALRNRSVRRKATRWSKPSSRRVASRWTRSALAQRCLAMQTTDLLVVDSLTPTLVGGGDMRPHAQAAEPTLAVIKKNLKKWETRYRA